MISQAERGFGRLQLGNVLSADGRTLRDAGERRGVGEDVHAAVGIGIDLKALRAGGDLKFQSADEGLLVGPGDHGDAELGVAGVGGDALADEVGVLIGGVSGRGREGWKRAADVGLRETLGVGFKTDRQDGLAAGKIEQRTGRAEIGVEHRVLVETGPLAVVALDRRWVSDRIDERVDHARPEQRGVAAEDGVVGEIHQAVTDFLRRDGIVGVGGEAPLAGELDQGADDSAGHLIAHVVIRRLVVGDRQRDEDVFAKRIGRRVAGDGKLIGSVAERHPFGLEGRAAVEGKVGEKTDPRIELVIDAGHQGLFAGDVGERAFVAAPDAGGEVEIVAAGVGEEAGIAGGRGGRGRGVVGDVREARAEGLAGGLERERDGLRVGKAVYGAVVQDDVGRGAAGEGARGGVECGGTVGEGALEVLFDKRAVLHAERFAVAVAAADCDVGAAAKREAVDGADGANRRIGVEGVLIRGADLAASVVALEDDVDDTADGGATVDGGRAAGEHLDAIDRGQRDTVNVGLKRRAAIREVRCAHAIDENQRLRGSEAAEVDRAGGTELVAEAAGVDLGVGFDDGVLREAIAEHVVEIGFAGIFDLLAPDDVIGLDVVYPARDVHVGIGERHGLFVEDLELGHHGHGVFVGGARRGGGRRGLCECGER